MDIQELSPDQFPFLLRQIEKPPKFLKYKGQLPPDSHKFLCVVGSRTHSSYGLNACKKIISGLRGYPIVIVSGMAMGIDSVAHETALEAGLKTIAIPGSGLNDDVLYPVSKRPLARQIVASGGVLISPFYNHQVATDWTFPVRNQVMAGLSHAILIIEARRDSGTMITARAASDYSRDLLAVPGSIFSDLSQGVNELIRDGATAITCSEDILEMLRLEANESSKSVIHPEFDQQKKLAEKEEQIIFKSGKPKDCKPDTVGRLLLDSTLSDNERALIKCISSPRLRDELIEMLHIEVSVLSGLLVGLELRGIVYEQDGYFVLK